MSDENLFDFTEDPDEIVTTDGGDENNNDNTNFIGDGGFTQSDKTPAVGEKQVELFERYFPFDPYPQQVDGVQRTYQSFVDGDNTVIEAACGTGKTLLSLTAAITAIRDPNTKYNNVLCLTSVKQQLEAFVDDMKSINDGIDDRRPVSGISLQSKADMCPYVSSGMIETSDIYRDCDTLRGQTRDSADGNPVRNYMSMSKKMEASEKEPELASGDGGWVAPYKDVNPKESDISDGCPFYAKHLARQMKEESPLEYQGMMGAEDVLKQGAKEGTCPHSAMMRIMQEEAEVIVGNYKHLFDPLTRDIMMSEVIGPDTILIIDEAHSLPKAVRQQNTYSIGLNTLNSARYELSSFITDPSDGDKNKSKELIGELENIWACDKNTVYERVETIDNVFQQINSQIVSASKAAMKEEYGSGWESKVKRFNSVEDQVDIGLRDPETVEQDKLSERFESLYGDDYEETISNICNDCETIAELLTDIKPGAEESETHIDSVSNVLQFWVEKDNSSYFRNVELTKRYSPMGSGYDHAFEKSYTVSLNLNNCIPSDIIQRTVEQFGSSVFMSATLAPLDVYRKVAGIDAIAEDESTDTGVTEIVYGLNFPEENRQSHLYPTTKFTYNNRGRPSTYDMNDTREEYADVLKNFVMNVDGNVLICMPSYSEGEWARDILNSSLVSKDVLLDQSSSNEETNKLKNKFFRGGPKVLITSMLGTLTEGVDYDGDKLSACLVAGIPIRSTKGDLPTAIRTAYEDEFGKSNGFEYAFTVPAVRKARQAVGRVIRGDDDVGIRAFADERYTSNSWDGVRDHFPEEIMREYRRVEVEDVAENVKSFFDSV